MSPQTQTRADTCPAPHKCVLTVRELLSLQKLAIPQYQRPYKWSEEQVAQLFGDIVTHKNKSSYRLGTVVFHVNTDADTRQLDIVDGQQRTLTLMLAVRALAALTAPHPEKIKRDDLRRQLEDLDRTMPDLEFTNETTKRNLYRNHLAIRRIITRPDFTEELVDYLLNKCAVVCFSLHDISEAFQFFDSQNSRGRDLEPHDLLKAYHLREFDPAESKTKQSSVERWEACETQVLTTLFAEYLYRIRNWANSESARYFGKADTPLFKGVTLHTTKLHPYVEPMRIVNHWVDHYNTQPERRIDRRFIAFPFQLDQPILNGRRFFEMTAHYGNQLAQIQHPDTPLGTLLNGATLDGYASRIFSTLKEYPGRNRTGDRYVRSMFDCLLLYYIDKFGSTEISRAVEKIFIWAYSLRLGMKAVQLASMDKYVLANNFFPFLKSATHPEDFLRHGLSVLNENRSPDKTKPIEQLFKEMCYYE